MRVFYATIIFVMTTASAAVPVDITGVWRVRLHSEGFADDFCTWALVGSSSGEVVGYQSACLFPQNAGPISGTIDAGTGAFDLFFDVPGDPACPSFTVAATLQPGGTAFSGTFDCPAFPLVGTVESLSRCGDGLIEGMENCDPGTADTPTDCCTFDCHFESAGQACNSDGTICTAQACDGTGSCVTGSLLSDGTACADDPCMTGQSCVGGVCTGGVPESAGTGCDLDGNVCTRDVCDGGGSCLAGGCWRCCDVTAGCSAHAISPCKQASIGHATLLLKDPMKDDRDKLRLGWKGEAVTLAEFGDPSGRRATTFASITWSRRHSLQSSPSSSTHWRRRVERAVESLAGEQAGSVTSTKTARRRRTAFAP
jgi:hypothetical protein